jgi:hypothetical protein
MAGSDATSVSTGNRTILGRIRKRGNRYLRMLFAQGARAILLRPMSWAKHSFGRWLTAAARRLHRNVLAAALANKLARIGEHQPLLTAAIARQGRSTVTQNHHVAAEYFLAEFFHPCRMRFSVYRRV